MIVISSDPDSVENESEGYKPSDTDSNSEMDSKKIPPPPSPRRLRDRKSSLRVATSSSPPSGEVSTPKHDENIPDRPSTLSSRSSNKKKFHSIIFDYKPDHLKTPPTFKPDRSMGRDGNLVIPLIIERPNPSSSPVVVVHEEEKEDEEKEDEPSPTPKSPSPPPITKSSSPPPLLMPQEVLKTGSYKVSPSPHLRSPSVALPHLLFSLLIILSILFAIAPSFLFSSFYFPHYHQFLSTDKPVPSPSPVVVPTSDKKKDVVVHVMGRDEAIELVHEMVSPSNIISNLHDPRFSFDIKDRAKMTFFQDLHPPRVDGKIGGGGVLADLHSKLNWLQSIPPMPTTNNNQQQEEDQQENEEENEIETHIVLDPIVSYKVMDSESGERGMGEVEFVRWRNEYEYKIIDDYSYHERRMGDRKRENDLILDRNYKLTLREEENTRIRISNERNGDRWREENEMLSDYGRRIDQMVLQVEEIKSKYAEQLQEQQQQLDQVTIPSDDQEPLIKNKKIEREEILEMIREIDSSLRSQAPSYNATNNLLTTQKGVKVLRKLSGPYFTPSSGSSICGILNTIYSIWSSSDTSVNKHCDRLNDPYAPLNPTKIYHPFILDGQAGNYSLLFHSPQPISTLMLSIPMSEQSHCPLCLVDEVKVFGLVERRSSENQEEIGQPTQDSPHHTFDHLDLGYFAVRLDESKEDIALEGFGWVEFPLHLGRSSAAASSTMFSGLRIEIVKNRGGDVTFLHPIVGLN